MTTVMTAESQEKVRHYITTRVLATRTQVQVAAQSNLTQSTISEIMRKRRNVSMRIVMELAKLTGDSVEYIMGDTAIQTPKSLGELPGYRDAEKKIRLVLMVDMGADFWLNIRDTTFPKSFECVTSELLYGIAKAAATGWMTTEVKKTDE